MTNQRSTEGTNHKAVAAYDYVKGYRETEAAYTIDTDTPAHGQRTLTATGSRWLTDVEAAERAANALLPD